jgi:hypothetical protein
MHINCARKPNRLASFAHQVNLFFAISWRQSYESFELCPAAGRLLKIMASGDRSDGGAGAAGPARHIDD